MPLFSYGERFALPAGHCIEHLSPLFCFPHLLLESNTEYPESVTVTARYIGA